MKRSLMLAAAALLVVLACQNSALAQTDQKSDKVDADEIARRIAAEEEAAQAGEATDDEAQGARRRGRGGRGGRGRGGRGGDGSSARFVPANRTTDLMLSEFIAPDPYILPHASDGTYYLFTSRLNDGGRSAVVAYKSKDLKIWEGPQTVFAVPDGIWANPRDGAWSPEVHEHKGKYYLFVTLQNRDAIFAEPPSVSRVNHLRGTVVAEATSPTGPFELIGGDSPHPPSDFMTLDGTLYVDPEGKPWMVYCHDWVQVVDGMLEAVPLTEDLSGTTGDPIFLFKASDGPWLSTQNRVTADERIYVASGPELFTTKDSQLMMLWSSHTISDGFVQTVARSASGKLTGPWQQLEPIVRGDSGHGMLFRSFEGQLMLAVQQPYGQYARARLYEMEDAGDQLKVVKRREDLDSRPTPPGGGEAGEGRRGGRGGRGRRGGAGGGRRGDAANRGEKSDGGEVGRILGEADKQAEKKADSDK